jgi:hypothetical protein
MEVVGVEFIALNHHIALAKFMPLADGACLWAARSAPTHQRLEIQQSAVTTISALNVSLDVKIKHSWTVRPCTPDGLRER